MATEVSNLDPSTVHLLDATGKPVRELTVTGEGTWTVDPKTGEVTFDPAGCFEGDVTPVTWQGTLRDGTPVTGTLDVSYENRPVDDKEDGFLANTGGPMLPLLLLGAGLLTSGVVLVTRRHSRGGGRRLA
jgi:CshA-type fibril repeat protein